MRILILYHNTLGGSSVVAYKQGIGMADFFGVEVHFLGWGPPFSMDPNDIHQQGKVFFHQVQMETYPSLSTEIANLFLISQVVDLIKKYKIHLIHCHYAVPFSLCATIARTIINTPVKIICTVHGTDIIGIGKVPTLFHTTQYGLAQSDAIVAVSKNLREHVLQSFDIPSKKVQVIYNFIHKEISLEIPHPLAIDKKFVIIFISNLRNIKNPIGALTIFRKFQQNKENCELWIVGDGPLIKTLQKKISSWNLQDSVQFFGSVKNIFSLLQQADVCLVSSFYESFCLVALESISCGVPVVAPNVGGIPELAETAPDAIYLYEETDCFQQPVDLLQSIYEDPNHYKIKVLDMQPAIKAVYSKEKILRQYFSLYNQLLCPEENI